MQDFKKVIKYFIPYLKKDRMKVFLIFLLYGMSTVLGGVITPVIYKKIIDALSDSPINQLLPLFITLVVITLIAFVVHRSGDYFLVHFQSKTLKDLYITSFKKLTLHSYNFFINSFSGGLVAKSKRFVNSFETIFDSICLLRNQIV